MWFTLQLVTTVYLLRTEILENKQWNAMMNALCIVITGYVINCLMFSINQFIIFFKCLLQFDLPLCKIIFKVYSGICNLIYHSAKNVFNIYSRCTIDVSCKPFLRCDLPHPNLNNRINTDHAYTYNIHTYCGTDRGAQFFDCCFGKTGRK